MPQGSCLGPHLFLLYINDLPFTLKKAKATMYADDTAISYASDNSDELDLVINEELSCIERWLQGNQLSLNVVKTQAMIIGCKPKINPNPHGGGVFSIPLEVFLAVFFKDINYVPQTYLTFTNYLFATF